MVRGRKSTISGTSGAISGHLDHWSESAVDYLDGRLDPSAVAAVQQHLQGCAECARRLETQRATLALFAHAPMVEAPPALEARVLAQLSERSARAIDRAPSTRRAARRRTPRRSRADFWPTGPWLPAMAGAAAVLALVLALTVSRGPLGAQDTMTTAAALLTAENESAQTLRSAEGSLPSSTAPVLLGSGDDTAASTESAADLAGAAAAFSAPMQPTGPTVSGAAAMASSLAGAAASAYFFFDNADGSLPSLTQADSVASRFTAATGLRLMDGDLSSGAHVFAAFVPRADSEALVGLLCSIGSSLELDVCMSLEPGGDITAWAETMLQDKYALVELSASPSKPPATAGWLYTTSTASAPASDDPAAPKLLNENGTHVLVVIYIAVQ